MPILEEEKAVIAALKKIKDWTDEKVILAAINFDKKEIKKLERVADAKLLVEKQFKAIALVCAHLRNIGAARISHPARKTYMILTTIENQLSEAHTRLKQADGLLQVVKNILS